MGRPRKNDIAGADGSQRRVATNPDRIAGLGEEFKRRLTYLERHFIEVRALWGQANSFNLALRELVADVAANENSSSWPNHPDLYYAVRRRAFDQAKGEITNDEIAAARRWVTENIKPCKHRPADHVLQHHVRAAMALIYEMSGKSVHATIFKSGIYAPQATDRISQFVIDLFRMFDPTITPTTIAKHILNARREYANKPMRFADFLPLYGCSVTPILAAEVEAADVLKVVT